MKLKAESRREFVLTLSISIKARVEAEPKERERERERESVCLGGKLVKWRKCLFICLTDTWDSKEFSGFEMGRFGLDLDHHGSAHLFLEEGKKNIEYNCYNFQANKKSFVKALEALGQPNFLNYQSPLFPIRARCKPFRGWRRGKKKKNLA